MNFGYATAAGREGSQLGEIPLPEFHRRLVEEEDISVSRRTLNNEAASNSIWGHRLGQSRDTDRAPQHWFLEASVPWYANEARYWGPGYKDALPLWPQGHGGPEFWPTRRFARATDYGKTQSVEFMKRLDAERRGDKLYVDRAALEGQWPQAIEDLQRKIHVVAVEFRDGSVGASPSPLVLGPIEMKPNSGRRFIPKGGAP